MTWIFRLRKRKGARGSRVMNWKGGIVLLLVSCSVTYTYGASKDPRIVEKDIAFPSVEPRVKGVPIVDPPTRVAGYFKLNRTEV